MKYENINESWDEYRESLQTSKYMQRLTLKEDEKVYMAGYRAAYEYVKRKLLKDLVEAADLDLTKEVIEFANKENYHKITRLEVIDHSPDLVEKERAYTKRGIKDLELSFQDEGRTLKVFIK